MRWTSGWVVRAVVGQAKEVADMPVDAKEVGPAGSVGFDRRAGCVDTTVTGDNSVRHSCCHWRMRPSRAKAEMRRS